MRPSHIVLHHSLTKDSGTVSWDAIRQYHKKRLYFKDIGYHFGIEKIGWRYEVLCGRMTTLPGAHCMQAGMNNRSIGICFVGNFDEQPVPEAQWAAGVSLVKSLMRHHGIDVANIHGHHEFAPHKSCPGKLFDVELFRRDVASLDLDQTAGE